MKIVPASFSFTLLLGVLAALPALSVDLSAPTLLLLPVALGTTILAAGLTLSLFMLGFALGQLVGGRLSDRVGRRPVLLCGLACFAAAGGACAVSASASALIAFRFVQGLGAGTCTVIAFAMVQDVFEGDAARTKRSYVTVVVGLAPLLAPALGAALTSLAGWRSVHAVLAAGGGLLLLASWFGLAETWTGHAARFRRQGTSVPPRPWLERRFAGVAVANAFSYGSIFAYIAGSPVVIMGQMGWPPAAFAAVFASTAAALSLGAWTSGRLGRRHVSASALLRPSLLAAAVATLVLAMAGFSQTAADALLLPPLLIVLFARGVIAPNLQHLAIERQQEQAGTASAIVGVLQIVAGALSSAVVAALLPDWGSEAVFTPMAVLATLAIVTWWWADAAGPVDL